jgi:hypothetical protein
MAPAFAGFYLILHQSRSSAGEAGIGHEEMVSIEGWLLGFQPQITAVRLQDPALLVVL